MAVLENIVLDPPDVFERLAEGLQRYQEVSGKTSAAILVQKGAQLIYGNSDPRYGAVFPGLAQLFRDQAPAPGAITSAAIARGFRLGDKAYGGDLSPEAYARARFWMGGNKSILARPTVSEGRISLGAIRVGKRGQRILGGRRGRGGSAISGRAARDAGEKRLNLRAVATVMEINLRESGRRFLSAGWLYRRWQRLAASDPRRDGDTWRQLVNNNPRSFVQPLGTAGLEGSEAEGKLELRITSYVPGVRAIGQGRGLFVRAIQAVNADIGAYLARHQGDELRDALRGALGLGGRKAA